MRSEVVAEPRARLGFLRVACGLSLWGRGGQEAAWEGWREGTSRKALCLASQVRLAPKAGSKIVAF